MTLPRVSIIVPVYNVEKYIKKCIDSILSQTFRDFELILVDDYSDDNSINICDELSQKDSRIKIIRNSKNLGASLSRKAGFEISSGKYIQFIDSDDWIENDMIERMIEKAEYENTDMVSCAIINHKNDKISRDNIASLDKDRIIKNIITTFGVCSVCNKLVKREILNKITFPNTTYAEDRFITLQTIYFSNCFGYIDVPFYHYEYNISSTTRKPVSTKRRIDLYDSYVLILDFVKKMKIDIKYLEPELSKQINSVKVTVFLDNNSRNQCNIQSLYPESHFCKYLFIKIMSMIYILIIPKLFQIVINRIKRKINYCNKYYSRGIKN